MTPLSRRLVLAACACLPAAHAFGRPTTGPYICAPCGCAMDGREFDGPGKCPACGMTLIPKPAVASLEPKTLAMGAGGFLVSGGKGREAKQISIQYYRPRNHVADSPILLVVPGAGRNADSYRDAWIAAADARGVLVAALGYPEADYDFAAYQMSGVIKNLQIANMPRGPNGQPPASVHLRDEDISFEPNPRPATWLFDDFDRIFDLLVAATGSTQTRYDIFGHSAGGQILHRMALFAPGSRAKRIIAANSGLYTQPDLALPQVMGLKDSGVTPTSLAASLACDLTLMLGELDNDGEEGGLQVHTPLIDRYGVDRGSRGRTFFKAGQDRAQAMNVPFNWSLEVVPGVGHDYRAMSRAAARRLYGRVEL